MTVPDGAQAPEQPAVVELFVLDATSFGGETYRFALGTVDDAAVTWGGNLYPPIAAEAEGFEVQGNGQLPRPKLRVANIDNAIAAAAIEFNDLLGAKLSRYRVPTTFLDGQPDADPTIYWGPDLFTVERKTAHNAVFLEWELSSAIDAEGKLLPGGQVLRMCRWRYRQWNGSAFAYDGTSAACPYTGTAYFTQSGVATADPAADRCGKQLRDCQARFGEFSELPFGGFPNVARVR